jgi:hypothetical protein
LGNVRVFVIGTPGSVAYIDDLGLKSVPPETPCPTDTPTPSDTPTPTETLPPTDTPTATATTTPTDTRTSTPTRTPTFTRTPTDTRTPTSTRAPADTPEPPTSEPPATDVAIATPTLTPSNGLLINGGFEAADGVPPAAWRHFGGDLTQTSEHVSSGAFAGRLTSASTSTKWVYQTVSVQPNAWYQFDAYVLHDDPATDAAWLRVSWYATSDASGSAIATNDSTETLGDPLDAFRYLTTGALQAPPEARSANVRIMLRPVSEGHTSIFFDDATFDVTEPATPTPTDTVVPTATPTEQIPTPTFTATRTATVTRTVTPTRTPTVTRTPTFTRTPTATEEAPSPVSATGTPSVLEASVTPTRRPSTPTSTPDAATPGPTFELPKNGLLVNGDFEVVAADKLVGWENYGGDVAQVDDPVQSGGFAGAFSSSTDSTKWLYQPVTVRSGAWYEFSAYVCNCSEGVKGALLRISWYASDDTSGSALSSTDSNEELSAPSDAYQLLTTGSVQAPADARSARARVVVRPLGTQRATLFVDNAWLVESDPAPRQDASDPTGPQDSDDPDGSASQSSSVSRSPARESQVAGAAQQPGLASQPSPVIRRGHTDALTASDNDLSSASDIPWHWTPPIAVATVIATATAIAWYRDRRTRPT